MSDVREVYGIGLKKSVELKKCYNITTISDLRKYVRKLPDIISGTQRIGLRYHKKISKSITKAEADKHAKLIKKNIPGAVIAGSYRRNAKTIGDIDVLITSDLDKAVKKLIDKKYIIAVLSNGDEKFSGVVKLPNATSYRRIDIVKTNKLEYPFALLYFTGDVVQNIHMRKKAKSMKYSLSQHGLKNLKTGNMVKGIKKEKDIFDFLKIPYKSPENRTHSSETVKRIKE